MGTSHIDFSLLEKSVFTEKENGGLLLGGEEISPEVRSVLREQAKYIQTSQFMEILNSTIINESAKIALVQSTDFTHVSTGKMLFYWNSVINKMIRLLAK